MRDVFDGAIVALDCLGDFHVPQHRFLDAITDQGRVVLSPGFNPPFTGARWQCMSLGDGSFALVSAGASFGMRYLDGRTIDGVVQTVGDTLPPFSGTHWRIQELSPGVVTIQCMGEFNNPQHRFLDGNTQGGFAGLAPNTNPPFSGTRWATVPLPAPSLEVHTEREQTGAAPTLRGSNFTPNDNIRFSAEGLVGRENHAPFPLPAVANANGSGSFETFARISFHPNQPGDLQVTIRATDHNGRTAHGFTRGFSP